MFNAWLLRLHRWLALLFALPLAVVLGTGLVLSFEPWLAGRAIKPLGLTVERVEQLLAQHDPQGKARAIAHRSYDGTVTIGGRGGKVVDVASGAVRAQPSGLAKLLVTSRRLHETLLLDAGWVVLASSFAMLGLAVLGVLMGWPRLANTLSGWHKAMSWGLLPLVVLSPLTGVFLATGVTFSGQPAATVRPAPQPQTLRDAIRIAGAKHDLAGLVWMRPARGSLLMRIDEGGEYKVYRVTQNDTEAMARNWPRLWHEGNFAGMWSALMNVVTSFAMIGLLVTGVWIWARRKMRLAARRRERAAAA
jgi:uncharacterized iron-regulated membrane protein